MGTIAPSPMDGYVSNVEFKVSCPHLSVLS